MGVSLRDVARQAGVSVGTASNVLNKPGIVAPSTLMKVQKVIDELGFIPNGFARHLRAGHSRTLGLIVPDASNPFFTEVARGVEDAASKRGYSVFLCNSEESNTKEGRIIQVLVEQVVRGVLITPAALGPDHLKALSDRGISATLIDRESRDGSQCSVSVDDIRGGEIATRHLAELGHRHIGFVSASESIAQVADRMSGVEHVAKELGLTISKFQGPSMNSQNGETIVEKILSSENRPTALFCANDLIALGVMRGLLARGVKIPEEISLIGYDDIPFASLAAIPLTSISQPAFQLGARATELLLSECEEPATHAHQTIKFEPQLQVRGSTGRVNEKALR